MRMGGAFEQGADAFQAGLDAETLQRSKVKGKLSHLSKGEVNCQVRGETAKCEGRVKALYATLSLCPSQKITVLQAPREFFGALRRHSGAGNFRSLFQGFA